MDPTGGWGLKLLLILVVAIILLWVFAPHAWALGISIALGVAFVVFILYVLSTARYT